MLKNNQFTVKLYIITKIYITFAKQYKFVKILNPQY